MDIDHILLKITEAIRPIIEEAVNKSYDDGKSVGDREAAARIKARLTDLLGSAAASDAPVKSSLTVSDENRQASTEDERATPGTVKPAILKAIQEAPDGMTTREIADKTGFKYNSVRGTVWTLQKERAIVKADGSRWRASPPKRDFEDLLGSDEPKRNEPPEEEYP